MSGVWIGGGVGSGIASSWKTWKTGPSSSFDVTGFQTHCLIPTISRMCTTTERMIEDDRDARDSAGSCSDVCRARPSCVSRGGGTGSAGVTVSTKPPRPRCSGSDQPTQALGGLLQSGSRLCQCRSEVPLPSRTKCSTRHNDDTLLEQRAPSERL